MNCREGSIIKTFYFRPVICFDIFTIPVKAYTQNRGIIFAFFCDGSNNFSQCNFAFSPANNIDTVIKKYFIKKRATLSSVKKYYLGIIFTDFFNNFYCIIGIPCCDDTECYNIWFKIINPFKNYIGPEQQCHIVHYPNFMFFTDDSRKSWQYQSLPISLSK